MIIKIVTAVLAFAFPLFLIQNASATLPRPAAERHENLVEKFQLYDIDTITLSLHIYENEFGSPHKGYDFSNTIIDRLDIANIIAGFSNIGSCQNRENRYQSRGKFTFYKKGAGVLSLDVSDHYHSLIFILDNRCYLSYMVTPHSQERFNEALLKYLPKEFRQTEKNKPVH